MGRPLVATCEPPWPAYIPESFVFTWAAFPQLRHLLDARDLDALQLLQNTPAQLLQLQ